VTTDAPAVHRPPTSGHLRSALLAGGESLPEVVLMVVAALLVASSGAIHLYLWDIAYRHVDTLGPLFLLQFVSAVIVALALIVVRRGFVLAAALGLMVGTLVGFALVITTGLFGFKLGFVSGWATLSLVAESMAVVLLVATATLLWRRTT
jgi:hypothetical protein